MAAASEILSLDEAKTHLRVKTSRHDNLIQGHIDAALSGVEKRLARNIKDGTAEIYIPLPSAPKERLVVKVVDYKSLDSVSVGPGDEGEFASAASAENIAANYYHAARHVILQLKASADDEWPVSRGVADERVLRVRMSVGMEQADIPKAWTRAMLLLVGAYYDKNDETEPGMTEMHAVNNLLRPWLWYGAD